MATRSAAVWIDIPHEQVMTEWLTKYSRGTSSGVGDEAMMDAKEREIASQLGIDPDDRMVQHALDRFNADAEMLDTLVRLRLKSGLTQEQVAERMNRDLASVARFEQLDSDPRLSTIRRYALAIGATVSHRVVAEWLAQ